MICLQAINKVIRPNLVTSNAIEKQAASTKTNHFIGQENKPITATSVKQASNSGAEKDDFKVPLPISQKSCASSSDGVMNLCKLFSQKYLMKI